MSYSKALTKLYLISPANINVDEFKTPDYNEDTMETNVNGVYLAGVICGGLKTNKWFIENSRDHSEKIVKHIVKS